MTPDDTPSRTARPAPRPVPRAVLAFAGVLLLTTAACSGDDATGPGGDFGNGTVQVVGSLSLSFSGPAVSGTDAFTDLPTFGVTISEDATGNGFDVVFMEGRPGPGTYALGSPSDAAYGELSVGSDLYESVVGEVRITSSSAQSIVGSATFTAVRLGGLESVSVTASFNAPCFAVQGLHSCQ